MTDYRPQNSGHFVGLEAVEDDGDPFEEKMQRLTATLSEQFAESSKRQARVERNLSDVLAAEIGGLDLDVESMMVPLPSTNERRIEARARHFSQFAKRESRMRENLGGLGYNAAQETWR